MPTTFVEKPLSEGMLGDDAHSVSLDLVVDVLSHLDFLDLNEASGRFQVEFVQAIFNTGKSVDDLTVRELRAIFENLRGTFS